MTDPAASPAADRRCPNCGAPAPRRFCPECGQRQDRRLASVRRMAVTAAQDQFSLGTELPRTLGILLFHPGRLTTDYMAGRVARYVEPLRLYLVSSLVFFVLLSWTSGFDDAVVVSDEIEAASDSVEMAIQEAGPDEPPSVTRRGPVQISIDEDDGLRLETSFDTVTPGPLRASKRWLQHRVDRVNAMQDGEFEQRFMEGLQENAPKAVFLLLPIYALLLKLVYLRRKRLYAEHFVYALHVHAFAFIVFTATLFLPGLVDMLLLVVWVPVYLFLAMRQVYTEPRWKAFLKFAFLFVAYLSAQGLVLGATALVTALTV